ncbi:hypothetical protein, partial [Sansalvadorimonas verongulae]|uniref:hypothetical protein n=1 Tax=Sansalvadorimonas verongulae TaxID=2172824 RepID=UPI0018AD250A
GPLLYKQEASKGHGPYPPKAQGSSTRRGGGNHGHCQLSQRRSQYSPVYSHVQPYHDINDAFSLLKTNPKKALEDAEILLKKYEGDSQQYARVGQLKARCLFLLGDFDGCIGFISSLSRDLQNNKGLVMAKGRALQARGRLMEALPLFQQLYKRYSASLSMMKKPMGWHWADSSRSWGVRTT